jgi:hypothetical protein
VSRIESVHRDAERRGAETGVGKAAVTPSEEDPRAEPSVAAGSVGGGAWSEQSHSSGLPMAAPAGVSKDTAESQQHGPDWPVIMQTAGEA